MAADLYIQICNTRRLKFMARQRDRMRIHRAVKQADGTNKWYTGHEEYKRGGRWYHQDLHEKIRADFEKAGIKITDKREVLVPERYDFLNEVRAPRLHIGDTNDPSGFTFKVADLFTGKVMIKIDDDFITKVAVYQDAVGDDSEWTVEENKKVIAFLEKYKGCRAYGVFW